MNPDLNPHHFGKLDPHSDPHWHHSGKLSPDLDLDPHPHQSEKQYPDPHPSEKVETWVILKHWRVQIWKKQVLRSGSGSAHTSN